MHILLTPLSCICNQNIHFFLYAHFMLENRHEIKSVQDFTGIMWMRLSTVWVAVNLVIIDLGLVKPEPSKNITVSEVGWTEWTACSKTCEQGIQIRTRRCLTSDTECSKIYKQVRVCQNEKCKGKTLDAREAQCRRFDNKVISGRRYRWSSYMHKSEPCQLYCKASYYGFYRKFDKQVEDGTSCKYSSKEGICIDGSCETVGCDGIVGSPAIYDHCGVCNGDSSTCQLISGIFTRRYLSYGYNLISRIPAGACNINITEMSRSRNYLALKITDGDYIFNGNYRLSRQNVFNEAGTTFTYTRNARDPGCRTQCIQAKGPTTKSIDLELLFYQVNTGITYQFTVPNNLTDYFMRNMIPNLRANQRNPQSSNNAQSTKQQNVYMITNPNELYKHQKYDNLQYRRPSSQEAVQHGASSETRFQGSDTHYRVSDGKYRGIDNQYLPQGQKVYTYPEGYDVSKQAATGDYGQQSHGSNNIPRGQESYYGNNGYPVYSNGIPLGGTANKPPLLTANNSPDGKNYFWRISGFTECSRTCGGGLQETQIICLKKDTNVMVTNENCDPRQRPQSQVLKCNSNICPPNWESGNWSDCSASCGHGMRTRPIVCKQLIDSDLHPEVPTSRCDTRTRPESARSCKLRPCGEWTTSEWGECSVKCRQGQKKREVFCKHLDGSNTTEIHCEGAKPSSVQSCDMGACAVGWLYSKWSRRCSTSCGKGFVTRRVFCAAADGTPLSEQKCSSSKPKEKRPCRNKIPCGGIWFEGPWSKCSATCGEGMKKRDVICMKKLDGGLITVVGDENCSLKPKPPTTKPCKDLPDCQSEWFMTSWSKCSKTCDTGVKSRLVKCLDQELQLSSTCDADRRPITRHSCNTDSCDLPQLDEDPSCQDKLQNCHLVAQAKNLCNYPFYSSTCCRSCKKHAHKIDQKGNR